MSTTPNRTPWHTKRSDQHIHNASFDEDFDIYSVEIAGYHEATDSLKRIATDDIGRLRIVIDSLTLVSSSVFEYASATVVPDNALTTVLSYTVVGSDLLLDLLIATGQVDAEWIITVNSNVKLRYRTSEQDRSLKIPFPTAQKFAMGDVITIKVIHYNTTGTFDFDASLIGHRS